MPSPVPTTATIVHVLPGRVRLRLVGHSEAEIRQLATALTALAPVRSARANPLTGTLLVHFDAQALDIATLEGLIAAPGQPAAVSRAGAAPPHRRATRRPMARRCSPGPAADDRPRPTTATATPLPPLTRVLWPTVHLLFAASPLGLVLHVGEVCWAVWPFVRRWRTAVRTPGPDFRALTYSR